MSTPCVAELDGISLDTANVPSVDVRRDFVL